MNSNTLKKDQPEAIRYDLSGRLGSDLRYKYSTKQIQATDREAIDKENKSGAKMIFDAYIKMSKYAGSGLSKSKSFFRKGISSPKLILQYTNPEIVPIKRSTS